MNTAASLSTKGSRSNSAAAGHADCVGRDIGEGSEGKRRPPATGEGSVNLPNTVDHPRIGGKPREGHAPDREAACFHGSVDRRPLIGEDDRTVRAAFAHRKGAGEIRIAGGEMGVDPLSAGNGDEIERAIQGTPSEEEAAEEAARIGPQPSTGVRSADVECGNGDHRGRVIRKQDLAVACERTEFDPPLAR